MDHGRVGPTTTTTNDVAQHGGHPANTKSCSLGLQRISLIVDIRMMQEGEVNTSDLADPMIQAIMTSRKFRKWRRRLWLKQLF